MGQSFKRKSHALDINPLIHTLQISPMVDLNSHVSYRSLIILLQIPRVYIKRVF